MAELDIRTGSTGNIDTIRYDDTRVIKATNNAFKVENNTGDVQLSIPKAVVEDFVNALRAAQKLLG